MENNIIDEEKGKFILEIKRLIFRERFRKGDPNNWGAELNSEYEIREAIGKIDDNGEILLADFESAQAIRSMSHGERIDREKYKIRFCGATYQNNSRDHGWDGMHGKHLSPEEFVRLGRPSKLRLTVTKEYTPLELL